MRILKAGHSFTAILLMAKENPGTAMVSGRKCMVRQGFLIIEGRKEQKPNPNYNMGSSDWEKNRENIEYTASSINTSGKHTWKYGRFVMRGRIDISAGLWPAWWTLGVAGQWPSNGEIDIMEYYKNKLLANIACGTCFSF